MQNVFGVNLHLQNIKFHVFSCKKTTNVSITIFKDNKYFKVEVHLHFKYQLPVWILKLYSQKHFKIETIFLILKTNLTRSLVGKPSSNNGMALRLNFQICKLLFFASQSLTFICIMLYLPPTLEKEMENLCTKTSNVTWHRPPPLCLSRKLICGHLTGIWTFGMPIF